MVMDGDANMDDYQVFTVIDGYQWLCVVIEIINGYGVSLMAINGCGWLLSVIDGYQWLWMVIDGYQ